MAIKKKFDEKGEKIQCKECGEYYHRLDVHIWKIHGMHTAAYLKKWPNALIVSEGAQKSVKVSKEPEEYYTPPVISAEIEGKSSIIAYDIAPEISSEIRMFNIGVSKLAMVCDDELTPIQKSDIPKHDPKWIMGSREMEYLEVIASGIEDNDNIFIFGLPGAGKTTIVKQLGAIINCPVVVFQFTNGIALEDFLGETKLIVDDNGNTVTQWCDGAFTRCWRQGYFIIFDEMSAASANILLRLHGPLDGDDLVLIENGGEVIPKHPRTRIFATDNTNGRGDETGLFSGTNVLNEATMDRFGTVISYDYPDEKSEVEIIISKSGIGSDDAEKMVKVARIVRESFKNEECYCTLSTRRLIGWAKKMKKFDDAMKSSEITILNKLSPSDRAFTRGIIQRIFGGSI